MRAYSVYANVIFDD